MAYCFGLDRGEKLDDNPSFRDALDARVKSSRSVTFVGWRRDTGTECIQYLLKSVREINVIEIFSVNAYILKNYKIPNVHVFCGDVRNYRDLLKDQEKDCLAWQDGPEHLVKEESMALLNKMKEDFNTLVIATPKGEYKQGALYGNPAECHLSAWEMEDYLALGFQSSIIAQRFLTGFWRKPT